MSLPQDAMMQSRHPLAYQTPVTNLQGTSTASLSAEKQSPAPSFGQSFVHSKMHSIVIVLPMASLFSPYNCQPIHVHHFYTQELHQLQNWGNTCITIADGLTNLV